MKEMPKWMVQLEKELDERFEQLQIPAPPLPVKKEQIIEEREIVQEHQIIEIDIA